MDKLLDDIMDLIAEAQAQGRALSPHDAVCVLRAFLVLRSAAARDLLAEDNDSLSLARRLLLCLETETLATFPSDDQKNFAELLVIVAQLEQRGGQNPLADG